MKKQNKVSIKVRDLEPLKDVTAGARLTPQPRKRPEPSLLRP